MIITSNFKPCRFIRNNHIQTVWPRLFNFNHSIYESERLELPDGDFLDLSWTGKPKSNQPIVIVFHGLEGSIESPYIQGIMNSLQNNDWCAVLMHFRGCSDEMNRLDRSYHSGDTSDIQYCIETLHERYPANKIVTLGYSLGGNALLKYLGEQKNNTPVKSAIAVSVPFQLNRGADRLEQGFSKIYQWYLVGNLRKKIQKKFNKRPSPIDISGINQFKTFWLFDHHITAPLHGFSSGKEYYRLSSSRQFLKMIEIPTLLIHAKDDPFLPADAIPAAQDLSDHVTLELSDYGGHVGFISGTNPLNPDFWLEQRIPEFIHEQLTKTD